MADLVAATVVVTFTMPPHDAIARTATEVADAVLALTGALAGLLLLTATLLWLLLAVSRVWRRSSREELPWLSPGGGIDLE